MNAEDWEHVRDCLENGVHWPVELLIEGRRVSLRTQRVKGNMLGITIFIDGWFRGEWTRKDAPERRFFQPVAFYLYSKKDRTSAIKRRQAKVMKINIDAKGIYYRSYWSSFKALKRHYLATFQEIALIKEAA